MNADDFYKMIRSRAPTKGSKREYLYIIKSFTYDMTLIYTKGKLVEEEEDGDVFYILISAKLALEG